MLSNPLIKYLYKIMSNFNDINDMVPCEICSEYITFNDYIVHLENCLVNSRTRSQINNFSSFFSDIGSMIGTLTNTTLPFMDGPIFAEPLESVPLEPSQRETEDAIRNIPTFDRIISPPRSNAERLGQSSNISPLIYNNAFLSNPAINRHRSIYYNRSNLTNHIDQVNNRFDSLNNNMFHLRRPIHASNIFNPGNQYRFIIPFMASGNIDSRLPTFFNIFDNVQNINDNDFDRLNDLENVTVSIDDINTVSKFVLYNDIVDKNTSCVICTDTIEESYNINPDTKYRITLCNHIVCDHCLSTWLNISKKCPSCNINLEDLLNKQNNGNITPSNSNLMRSCENINEVLPNNIESYENYIDDAMLSSDNEYSTDQSTDDDYTMDIYGNANELLHQMIDIDESDYQQQSDVD